MVFPTKFAYNPMEEMATLKDFPDFRFFATARSTSPTPLWDLATEGVTCDAQPCDRWLTVEQATAVQPGKLPKSPLPNTFLANFSGSRAPGAAQGSRPVSHFFCVLCPRGPIWRELSRP